MKDCDEAQPMMPNKCHRDPKDSLLQTMKSIHNALVNCCECSDCCKEEQHKHHCCCCRDKLVEAMQHCLAHLKCC